MNLGWAELGLAGLGFAGLGFGELTYSCARCPPSLSRGGLPPREASARLGAVSIWRSLGWAGLGSASCARAQHGPPLVNLQLYLFIVIV
jgi:hypothetical protein